jgi:PHD/YefM family antitoxin component YafN of YafNO toxin-antitoxin module
MTETTVSASHFRVHLKEIANSVKAGEEAVTVERHGCQMFAAVSLEDLEFLRRHKYGAAAAAPSPREARAPEPARAETIKLIHPDYMPLELVEEAYEHTNGSTDRDVMDWRGKAWFKIKVERGKAPKHLPYKFPD